MSRESPCSQEQCVGCVTMNLPSGSSLIGPKHITLVPAKLKTQLQSADGSCVFEAQTSQTDGTLSLLHALARLVSRDGAFVTGVTLQAVVTGLSVRLDVHLPLRLWEGTVHWKRSTAAALVFAELAHTPAYPAQLATSSKPEEFSLSSCFLELPSYVAIPAVPPPSPSPCQQADMKPSSSLEALPDYIMAQMLSQLSHRDLACASSVCTALRDQAQHTVPGLNLHLYPHQRRALQWMLKRERVCNEIEDPCWKGLVSSGGLPCWVCTATGQFAVDPPPALTDCRGGLFCDEPGLGKTITGLALICKTRGTIHTTPLDPDGNPFKCTWVKDPTGRPAAFYTAASSSKPNGATRTSRRTSSSSAVQLTPQSQQLTPQPTPITPLLSHTEELQPSQDLSKRHKTAASVRKPSGSSHSSEGQDRQILKGSIQEGNRQLPGGSHTEGTAARTADGNQNESDASVVEGNGHNLMTKAQEVHSASAGAQGLAGTNYVWVQCDLCNKWRELPKGHQIALDMYSSRSRMVATRTLRISGKCCSSHGDMARDRTSVAWWLARQTKQAIHDGVSVPAAHRKTPGWEAFLKEVGLVWGELPKSLKKTGSKAEALTADQPASASGMKRKRNAGRGRGCWKQPWQISSLYLDTEALLTALQTGPAEEERKVYLSAATLLVLPPTLIPHWLHQIRVHLKPNTLRVAVLAGDRSSADEAVAGVRYWGSGREWPLHELAWGHDLVITTFTRLSADWTHHPTTSPLKQVHWLRVILDEGHMLGASLAITNKLQMACALRADRRWVMSGTPTPSTPTSHVAHLQPLLAFLQQQPYGTHRKTWEDAVQKPFEARQRAGRERLMALLSRIMIRAAKSDLVTIPPCHHKVTRLDFAPEHAYSYNELIEVVKLNLLLADWNDEDHNESLLSVRNSKWGKEMLRNVRLSCCVAGNCDLAVKETDVKETLELLGERLGFPQPQAEWAPWVPSDHPLACVETALRHGGACQQCGAVARLLVVAPCAHLFCLDCVSMDRQACPSCRKPYQMQSVSDPIRLENNPYPKWDVPMDVIEWQCSYTQKGALGLSGGAWSANWQVTKSTKCVHLLRRLMDIGAVPNCPASQASQQQGKGLTKAIVFSQFWMHIQLISSHLRAHRVPLAVLKQDMSPKDKAAAVATFQHEAGVGVLLMDETGSVGLDLSFVSWVFLMEPLADASLQAQVTARAHRMGAAQAVHVETLVMRGTAEEQMLHHVAHPSPDVSATPHARVNPNMGAENGVEAPTTLHPSPDASLEVSPGPQCVIVSTTAQRKLNPDECASVQAETGSTQIVAGQSSAAHTSAESQHEIAVSSEAMDQETGLNPNLAADSQHEAGMSSVTAGRERVPSLNSPAGSQQEVGVSSAAAGRERSEAARRGVRNRLLLSLHRVAVTELAEYEDLPLNTGTDESPRDAKIS
ncbi:TPA: hypothetical protein ACH3X2_007554 [Trebouxia sp. C0005]